MSTSQTINQTENTHESSVKTNEHRTGLKHGQFRAKLENFVNGEKTYEWHVINPLTQEELADGWKMAFPRLKLDSTIHHFNVYKSQLPFHLWKKLKAFHNEDFEEEYSDIRNGIYTYSVKHSKYDDLVTELGRQVLSNHPNLNRIRVLSDELEQHRVKGWVMIRARTLLESM